MVQSGQSIQFNGRIAATSLDPGWDSPGSPLDQEAELIEKHMDGAERRDVFSQDFPDEH
jgi:hypothetical protein